MHFRFYIIMVMCMAMPGLHAQVREYTSHVTRSFRVSNAVSLEINNKYGRVHVIPWDEDSVKFNIDLRIRAKDNAKIEKMKQNIDFDFTSGQSFLIAQTRFGDSGSDVFKDLVDIAGSYLSSANSVSINYTVMVPAYIALKIENKFGDVYFDDHSGSLNLILSYGNLKANRLNGRTELKLSSGDAEINYLRDGYFTLSYGNLHIRDASKLIAQTQSSKVTIEKSGTLRLNSRRDKLYLNEVNGLSGDSYFSTLIIGTVHNSVTYSCRYGSLSVENIEREFSLIDLSSELTGITLSFERPLSFNFDFIHPQAITFAYPEGFARLTTKFLNEQDKTQITSGKFGSGNPNSRVIIKAMRKCNVTILER